MFTARVCCVLVCSCRLYLGMHSLLDILAGLLLAAAILLLLLGGPIGDQLIVA